MFKETVDFIRNIYQTEEFIPLHAPVFIGNERKYVNDTLDSSIVSSIGPYVNQFEIELAKTVGANYAVATSNGTSALHISLILSGVDQDSEVLTQSLTFVATCNAISYCNATPHFIDVDKDTLGMSPVHLSQRLKNIAEIKKGVCYNKETGKRISACVPMHTFGHACKIDEIADLCREYHIPLVEDAAEALGSSYRGKALGTFGKISAFSFNGNKIITAGGGGAIVTDNEEIAKLAKHLTTTAKVPHNYEYVHDSIGYNYRMPNMNAALLLGQLENLELFLKNKRELALKYSQFFNRHEVNFHHEPENSCSNYWLNAIYLEDKKQRDEFLRYTNDRGVMTRPIWRLMNTLAMFKDCPKGELSNSEWLENRIVNIPSSYVLC